VFLFCYYVFVCIPPGKAVPEMTYTVSGGTLNSTHSLIHLLTAENKCFMSVSAFAMKATLGEIS